MQSLATYACSSRIILSETTSEVGTIQNPQIDLLRRPVVDVMAPLVG